MTNTTIPSLNKLVHLCGLSFLLCSTAYADLPLTMESLTADKNKFKLKSSLNYFNQTYTNTNNNGFNNFELEDGRILSIPYPISEGTNNIDSLVANVGIDYGLTDKLAVGIAVSGMHDAIRIANELGYQNSTKDSRLQDVSLSTEYQLTHNHTKFPDSLLFTEVSAYDNSEGLRPAYGSTVILGGSVYKINDPISLSLTGTYQYNGERVYQSDGSKVDIGDVLAVKGSLGFAVNPDITLSTGVGWRSRQANKIDSYGRFGSRNTRTSLSLGMAYAVSERSTLTGNLRTNVSGESGSTLSLGWTRKIGELPPPLSQKYRQKLAKRAEPTE